MPYLVSYKVHVYSDSASARTCTKIASKKSIEKRALCRTLLANNCDDQQFLFASQLFENLVKSLTLDLERSTSQNVNSKTMLDQLNLSIE